MNSKGGLIVCLRAQKAVSLVLRKCIRFCSFCTCSRWAKLDDRSPCCLLQLNHISHPHLAAHRSAKLVGVSSAVLHAWILVSYPSIEKCEETAPKLMSVLVSMCVSYANVCMWWKCSQRHPYACIHTRTYSFDFRCSDTKKIIKRQTFSRESKHCLDRRGSQLRYIFFSKHVGFLCLFASVH